MTTPQIRHDVQSRVLQDYSAPSDFDKTDLAEGSWLIMSNPMLKCKLTSRKGRHLVKHRPERTVTACPCPFCPCHCRRPGWPS